MALACIFLGGPAVSQPDDEIRQPDDHFGSDETTPDETLEDSPEDERISDSASGAELSGDDALDSEVSEAEPDAEGAAAADEPSLNEPARDETDAEVDFAAPAEMESSIGFESMEFGDESVAMQEEASGDEPSAEFDAGVAEFGVGEGLDESGDESDESAEAEEEAAPEDVAPAGFGERLRRVMAAVGKSDPYTVLMGIALIALLFGILFFYLELSAYNFDIGAERAKQLVGALGLGWL